MSKIVFLLGAGASADAGFPLMAELTARFRDELGMSPGPDREDLLATFDAAVSAARTSPEDVPNIERVLQLLADVEALKAGAGKAVVAEWTKAFGINASQLEKLGDLARSFIRATLSVAAPGRADYLHGLLDFQDDEPVDVFTLNYDRLVEDTSVRYDVRYTTGFAETWDPALFSLTHLQLRLYKLHGSVDWYRLVARNVVFRGGPVHPAFREETSTDVLLYPTRGKNAFADPFATLVSRFNEALAKASFCVAVGYSFRDAHIRRLVLDRLATSSELQLLVVDPSAGTVLDLKGEEPGEPTFAHVAHRVSGLWQTAKYSLENRGIRYRIDEITGVDGNVQRAVEYRNGRQFKEAAATILHCVDQCRRQHLPYKPLPFFRQPFGHEFGQALSEEIDGRITNRWAGKLRIPIDPKKQDNWKDVGAAAMAEAVVNLTSDWLLAVSLRLPIAEKARQLLEGIVTRYAAGLLFLAPRSWRLWGSPYPVREVKSDLTIRLNQLRACFEHFATYPPVTGLTLLQDTSAYDVLLRDLRILSQFHERLLERPVGVRKPYGEADAFVPSVPRWQNEVSIMSGAFLESGAPEVWLGAPSSSGTL